MLDGLPTLFEWVNSAVSARPQRSSLEVVLFHLRGDLVNAADAALTTHFPKAWFAHSGAHAPDRPGAGYYEWATPVNADFAKVDACLRGLLAALGLWYEQAAFAAPQEQLACKDVWVWFHCADHDYRCCLADPRRTALRLGSINLEGWADVAAGRFLPATSRSARQPPVVTTTAHDISGMEGIDELRRAGFERVEEMRAADARYAAWMRAECAMSDVTRPHAGTLLEGILGGQG